MLTTRVARARSCTLIRDEIYTPSEMRTRRKGGSESKRGLLLTSRRNLCTAGRRRSREGWGEGCVTAAQQKHGERKLTRAHVFVSFGRISRALFVNCVRSFTAHGFNRSRRAGLIGLAYSENPLFRIGTSFFLYADREQETFANEKIGKRRVERRQMSPRSKCFDMKREKERELEEEGKKNNITLEWWLSGDDIYLCSNFFKISLRYRVDS